MIEKNRFLFFVFFLVKYLGRIKTPAPHFSGLLKISVYQNSGAKGPPFPPENIFSGIFLTKGREK
jgi:hypothetical protein